MSAVWTDPDFDPSQRAAYSVRVMEIPTPGWTTYDAVRKAKLEEALNGNQKSIELAKKHKLLIGYGTDLLFSCEGRKQQLLDLSLRKQWFSSAEVMVRATGNGGLAHLQ